MRGRPALVLAREGEFRARVERRAASAAARVRSGALEVGGAAQAGDAARDEKLLVGREVRARLFRVAGFPVWGWVGGGRGWGGRVLALSARRADAPRRRLEGRPGTTLTTPTWGRRARGSLPRARIRRASGPVVCVGGVRSKARVVVSAGHMVAGERFAPRHERTRFSSNCDLVRGGRTASAAFLKAPCAALRSESIGAGRGRVDGS